MSQSQWRQIITDAPAWWGNEPTRKHNLIILIEPYDMKDIIAAIGTLKPDIEAIAPGDGVIYQSLSLTSFGRTTSGKLASNPIYKKMTIRGRNTLLKIGILLDAML